MGLTYAMLVPLTFPPTETAAFFSTTLLERRPPFDFVDLYIPANPFHSLANNIVPAVVLFSIVLGVAVIGLERKPVLLDLLHVVSAALARATRFIVQLTPYGLFAIAATAAGTLSLEQLGRLQVYLIAYVGVALLVSLWVLPGLVAALTPIRMRDIFSLTRNALITAFVAGDLFIVLPVLIESSRTLIERAGVGHVAGEAAGGHRPGLVQLSPHREAAVDQLHPVRGLVCRRRRAAHRVSAAGADRARHVLRQRQRRGAVPARSLPDPGRHVSAVPGERRDQLAVRHARRGDAYAGGRAARDAAR